jgi:hypothetical protein
MPMEMFSAPAGTTGVVKRAWVHEDAIAKTGDCVQ